MNEPNIRRAAVALLQEVAHYQMINGKLEDLAAVQDRLESATVADMEQLLDENISYVSSLGDLMSIMGGNFELETSAVITITIQRKLEITVFGGKQKRVDIKTILNEGEKIKVYQYANLLDDVHRAYKTGRVVDIEKYDIAKLVREMGNAKS